MEMKRTIACYLDIHQAKDSLDQSSICTKQPDQLCERWIQTKFDLFKNSLPSIPTPTSRKTKIATHGEKRKDEEKGGGGEGEERETRGKRKKDKGRVVKSNFKRKERHSTNF
eukprot:TRINITY_DN1553_c0_g1_i5.p4 TRINITY_DN1553_c0_g1~~TRINITY_DN1553_c0_g1_i5.p4  ORF type:complete len:112 (+),score=39.83 TRINITY_DN1553_c0_g1_i5:258-593(+)